MIPMENHMRQGLYRGINSGPLQKTQGVFFTSGLLHMQLFYERG